MYRTMDYKTTEVSIVTRGRNVLRKKFPKNFDANAQDNKHLAQIPYNVCNKLITRGDVEAILRSVGVECAVTDLSIYQMAFVHKSYLHDALVLEDVEPTGDPQKDLLLAMPKLVEEGYVTADFDPAKMVPLQRNSSERLEYLGDSICGASVGSYLYHRFPEEDEGFLTKLRTKLVCGTRLGEFAEKLGMQEFAIISRYIELCNNGRKNFKVLEDLFESFVGALFEDNNQSFDICNQFMVNVIEKFIDFAALISLDSNYKDQLLRKMQSDFDGAYPRYKELSVDIDSSGVKIYNMAVLSADGTQIIGRGSHRKKRESEQISSRQGLVYLGVLDE